MIDERKWFLRPCGIAARRALREYRRNYARVLKAVPSATRATIHNGDIGTLSRGLKMDPLDVASSIHWLEKDRLVRVVATWYFPGKPSSAASGVFIYARTEDGEHLIHPPGLRKIRAAGS